MNILRERRDAKSGACLRALETDSPVTSLTAPLRGEFVIGNGAGRVVLMEIVGE